MCASYSEELKYERSVTSQDKQKIDGQYVEFVFYHTDHNMHTVDERDGFHVFSICIQGWDQQTSGKYLYAYIRKFVVT